VIELTCCWVQIGSVIIAALCVRYYLPFNESELFIQWHQQDQHRARAFICFAGALIWLSAANINNILFGAPLVGSVCEYTYSR
jgi:hypothetical protein